MKSNDFIVTTCQFAFFTPAVLFSKNKIIEAIIQAHGDVFNGDTIVVPLPPDAPKEIPRIILQSADNRIKLEIAENRVNMYRNQQDKEIVDMNQFLALCLNVAKTYKESSKAIIGRIALVIVKYFETPSPAVELVNHFCKEKWKAAPFDRPENFEIHGHKKYQVAEGFSVNSWVRCKTANLKEGNAPIVLVTQDINTLAEETEGKDFALADVEKYLKFVQSEQDKILQLYFPNE